MKRGDDGISTGLIARISACWYGNWEETLLLLFFVFRFLLGYTVNSQIFSHSLIRDYFCFMKICFLFSCSLLQLNFVPSSGKEFVTAGGDVPGLSDESGTVFGAKSQEEQRNLQLNELYPTVAMPSPSPTTKPTYKLQNPTRRTPKPTYKLQNPTRQNPRPTPVPTVEPSVLPSAAPSITASPTKTALPSRTPTLMPTPQPTFYFMNPDRTTRPTPVPTVEPSVLPSAIPSVSFIPTKTALPTVIPSMAPSDPPRQCTLILPGANTPSPTTSPKPSRFRRFNKAPTVSPKPSSSPKPSREPFGKLWPSIPDDFNTQFPDKSITRQLATKIIGTMHGCTDEIDTDYVTYEYSADPFGEDINGLDATLVTFVPEEEPTKKYTVLVFNATNDSADYTANLDIRMNETSLEGAPDGVKVHRGFQKFLHTLTGCSLMKETTKLIRQNNTEKMLYILGYGSGGTYVARIKRMHEVILSHIFIIFFSFSRRLCQSRGTLACSKVPVLANKGHYVGRSSRRQ